MRIKSFFISLSVLLSLAAIGTSCQRREEPFLEQRDVLYTEQQKEVDFQKLAQEKAKHNGDTSKETFIEEPGDIKGSYKKLTGNIWIFQFDKNGRILLQEKYK